MNMKELARRLIDAGGDAEKFGNPEEFLEYLAEVENASDVVLEKIPVAELAAAQATIQSLTATYLAMKGKHSAAMLMGIPNQEIFDAISSVMKLTIGIAALEEWR